MAEFNCRIKPYIQPFERCLALSELRAVAGAEPIPTEVLEGEPTTFKVITNKSRKSLCAELAYWESVGSKTTMKTRQIRSEATSLVARNGVALRDLPNLAPSLLEAKSPNKRCLRYATHGIHEYRGKFFPQLVRAMINMAEVPRDGIVLDPMCGSGTTLVEAVLAGRAAIGLDMNPLSVFISDVKCQVLRCSADKLVAAHDRLAEHVSSNQVAGNSYFSTLSEHDQSYLRSWFDPNVLDELDRIVAGLEQVRPKAIRQFYTLSLSNILRRVSLQKVADLRVRKEKKKLKEGDATKAFLDEIMRVTKLVTAHNAFRGQDGLGMHTVRDSDAKEAAESLEKYIGGIDAVITSPPYATALPYLDTDRLSLIYLGLLARKQHRHRDVSMIGNREVTSRQREEYWAHFEAHKDRLPKSTRLLIEQIDQLNRNADVGFRRKNTSALLSKYFFDMQRVLKAQKSLLRDSGTIFMVVGNNRTTAGGKDIEIRTTDQLAAIGEELGLTLAGRLSMDMLISRDIFRQNAMPSEEILTFQKV
ncbi:MAG: DNA methyltransferase [Pseudomonadota bacterium]